MLDLTTLNASLLPQGYMIGGHIILLGSVYRRGPLLDFVCITLPQPWSHI